MIKISIRNCVGCARCQKACPFGAIEIVDRKAVVNAEKCSSCGSCVDVCKFNAISRMEEEITSSATGDVWVFCELDGCHLSNVSRELVSCARQLRVAGTSIVAVILGSELSTAMEEAAQCGVDTIIAVADGKLEHYDDQIFSSILCRLIRKYDPSILLGGATAIGRALLPRCSVMLHTGLTADCTSLAIEPETGLLLQTRPAFGGNILATIKTVGHRPQMATVRPGVMKIIPCSATAPKIIHEAALETELKSSIEWLDFIPKAVEGASLRDASVIVTAGYGCGGPEGVALVKQFADKIGATLGASRPVVDAGWLAYSQQVGQTGTTVQPDLYIAVGVSGAIQHWVGMSNSTKIIAINQDSDCQMMKQADYAVQANLFELLPLLISKL